VVITAVGAVSAMFVVQSIDTRQVALAHVQDQLLAAQSQYAAAVSQITKNASPEYLASKVGGSNLVVPTSVSQILRVMCRWLSLTFAVAMRSHAPLWTIAYLALPRHR
jgi:hypothetical protein